MKCKDCLLLWAPIKHGVMCMSHMEENNGAYSPVKRNRKNKCKDFIMAPLFMLENQRKAFKIFDLKEANHENSDILHKQLQS